VRIGRPSNGSILLFTLLFILFVNSGSASGADTFHVFGQVTLFSQPLPDILVRIEGQGITREVSTDSNGGYSFMGIPVGEYQIIPVWEDKLPWWKKFIFRKEEVYSFLPASRRIRVQDGDVQVEEFRTVPYLMPEPKMPRDLGLRLPLGGGEGYTLTPSPSEATKTVEPGNVASLIETIRKGKKGDLIYVPPGDYLLVNDKGVPLNIVVPDGVTVFGSRDETIIRTVDVDDIPPSYEMWIMGNNTRLTGLTIEGPDKETGPLTGYLQLEDGRTIATAYYKPTATGILITQKTEIDNISIRGFPYAAILLKERMADGFVHHSYIADNVRTGLGYGVLPLDGAYVEVAYCKFYRNRHSMDCTGGSYYVHDSHFDSENPMGIGVIFQHAQKKNGLIVIQDNTIVNAFVGIHMFAGYGVVSGNSVDVSRWAMALRRRDGEGYLGYLHDFEIFDNRVINGNYYLEKIRPEDNVHMDKVNIGKFLEEVTGHSGSITLEKSQWEEMIGRNLHHEGA
jgi:hypothetical protein